MIFFNYYSLKSTDNVGEKNTIFNSSKEEWCCGSYSRMGTGTGRFGCGKCTSWFGVIGACACLYKRFVAIDIFVCIYDNVRSAMVHEP